METIIQEANKQDIGVITRFARKLDEFNQKSLGLFIDVSLAKIEVYIKEYKETFAKDNYKFFIAKVDNKIVGYCCGYIDFDITYGNYGMAEELYVEEDYRSLGIARLLMDKREEFFKHKNANIILTEIFENNKRSLEIHFKDGYEVESKSITLIKKLK